MENYYVIGITGGTSSGKTSVANAIISCVGSDNISYLCHDYYYKDLSNICIAEIDRVNFDHPNSLDTNLLIQDLKQLLSGKNIRAPIYDFTTHTRLKDKTNLIIPKKIILIEGILVLHCKELRELMNIKIFVDTEADERLMRRINRDRIERGRTISSILEQYKNTVKPMHQQFIEPTKTYADIIIPSGYNQAAVDLVVSCLLKKIKI